MNENEENSYYPEKQEFDITTDEDLLRWRMNEVTEKPCHLLQYCPYGSEIVESIIAPDHYDRFLCDVFKHHCPVFYLAEPGEDMDFIGIDIAEKALESIGMDVVRRANHLPPRVSKF